MSVYETILSRRSIRRYDQNRPVPEDILEKCVNAARLAPTARNLQPLEFLVVNETGKAADVFETIHWGGFAPDGKVEEGKRATAYIVVLANLGVREAGYDQDVGIAAENIVLTALEHGIGSCMLRAVNWERLIRVLEIPETHLPVLVISMGYPVEAPLAEDARGNDMTYFQDPSGVLHIPKRKLHDVMHRNGF